MAVRYTLSTDRYDSSLGMPAAQVYTMSCWAYLSVNRVDQSICFALHGTNTDIGVGTTTDGLTHRVYDHSGSVSATTAFTVGAWSRLAVTVNGTALVLYTGSDTGALTVTSATRSTTPNPATSFWFGSDRYANFFNGRLAAMKLWQATLTAAEISWELAQFAPARTANLLHYHPLFVPSLSDFSGNGYSMNGGGTTPTTEADPPIPEVAARPTPIMGMGAAVMRAGSW